MSSYMDPPHIITEATFIYVCIVNISSQAGPVVILFYIYLDTYCTHINSCDVYVRMTGPVQALFEI